MADSHSGEVEKQPESQSALYWGAEVKPEPEEATETSALNLEEATQLPATQNSKETSRNVLKDLKPDLVTDEALLVNLFPEGLFATRVSGSTKHCLVTI
jgi:hypothetical protein